MCAPSFIIIIFFLLFIKVAFFGFYLKNHEYLCVRLHYFIIIIILILFQRVPVSQTIEIDSHRKNDSWTNMDLSILCFWTGIGSIKRMYKKIIMDL